MALAQHQTSMSQVLPQTQVQQRQKLPEQVHQIHHQKQKAQAQAYQRVRPQPGQGLQTLGRAPLNQTSHQQQERVLDQISLQLEQVLGSFQSHPPLVLLRQFHGFPGDNLPFAVLHAILTHRRALPKSTGSKKVIRVAQKQ